MSLSINKCAVLKYGENDRNYSIDGVVIHAVEETRDLGVFMKMYISLYKTPLLPNCVWIADMVTASRGT